MKYRVIYLGALFIGLPMIMLGARLVTMPEAERQAPSETAKDLNGHIYQARISCSRGGEHVMRVHGRSAEDARRKLEARLKRCDVEILDGTSVPLWREAIRSVY